MKQERSLACIFLGLNRIKFSMSVNLRYQFIKGYQVLKGTN